MVQIEQGGLLFATRAGASQPAIHHAVLAAQRLVTAGAIMTLPGPRLEQQLVGYLEWLEPQRLFWFTAYGEALSDGHLLEFDTLQTHQRGITFSAGGRIVSLLTTIDHAGVDDPDDYRIAWQLWQEVAPLRRTLIEACAHALTRGASRLDVIDGIDGQPWQRRGGTLAQFGGMRPAPVQPQG